MLLVDIVGFGSKCHVGSVANRSTVLVAVFVLPSVAAVLGSQADLDSL